MYNQKMKYIILLLLLLPSAHADAATYWVDGSFQVLTERQVDQIDSYISPVPDSFLIAKQHKKCFSKYETVKKRLIGFEEKNKDPNLKVKNLVVAREKLIAELDTKYIQPCLKRYGTMETETKSPTSQSAYEDLEARIEVMESQIRKIIGALQSLGELTDLKK
jgi:ribosomal 50S subunit-associated protein YjgA (DUF615 family)